MTTPDPTQEPVDIEASRDPIFSGSASGGSEDRREHGGAPAHLDDDELQRRTEKSRIDAGLDDYDASNAPAATDETVPVDDDGDVDLDALEDPRA